jgi:hypothetical protein
MIFNGVTFGFFHRNVSPYKSCCACTKALRKCCFEERVHLLYMQDTKLELCSVERSILPLHLYK